MIVCDKDNDKVACGGNTISQGAQPTPRDGEPVYKGNGSRCIAWQHGQFDWKLYLNPT